MEDISRKSLRKPSIFVKTEPELLETRNSNNCSTEAFTLENNDEVNDMNESRYSRKRICNLRYISDEENNIALDPLKLEVKTLNNSCLLQEPSLCNKSKTKRQQTTVDDPLKQILIQIGLLDELYIFLKSRGITAQALKYMKIRHIDELFKGACLNTKIIFEHRLQEWQDKNRISNENGFYKVNHREENLKSHMDPSIHQILSETDITNLTNILTDAVQQTIHTVLQKFNQTCRKQPNDMSPNYNNEVSNEITKLKSIKTEENCNDETNTTNETSKKIVSNSQKILKAADEILPRNRSVDFTMSSLPKKRKLNVGMGVNIKEILARSTTCQNLLDEYEKSGLLTPMQRTDLVRCVVDFCIRNNLTIKGDICKVIAEKIVELFPAECVDTYFAQCNKNRPPKGKIWERYQYRKRSIDKLSIINLHPEETSKNDAPISDKDDKSNNCDQSELQEICSQMKHINDEKELLENWKRTFSFRRHQLSAGWFSNWKMYFDEYPFCKQQTYALYIESDLQTLYPNLKFDDFLWDAFLKNFPTFFLNRIKHPKSKQLYDELISMENFNTFTDYVQIKVFELLYAVLKLYTNKSQGMENGNGMFTVEVSDLSELKKIVIERKKYCTDNNIQAKPYIAVVGKNKRYSHFSVILDSTGFSCDNYKDSLILCFNLYLFFDISFPHETLNVWTFIQKYFFNKPPLVRNPRVDTFINEIKSHKTTRLDITTDMNNVNENQKY